jgi:hypothetical protein
MTLAERVEAIADLAPLSQLSALQRSELERELAAADALEDLPGKWQAAVLEAEAHSAGHTSPPSARPTETPSCCSAASRAAT